jgi:hypothetical protein
MLSSISNIILLVSWKWVESLAFDYFKFQNRNDKTESLSYYLMNYNLLL